MRTPLAEPAERGRLDIHPVVLRKIVEHAADGVPGTLRNERRLAGIDVGEYGASARVTVGTGEPAPGRRPARADPAVPGHGAHRGRRRARPPSPRSSPGWRATGCARCAVTVTGLRGPSAPAPARLR